MVWCVLLNKAAIVDKEILMISLSEATTLTCKLKEKALLEEFCFGSQKQTKNCAGAKLNANIVGKPAAWIAEQAGFNEGTNIAAECKKLVKRTVNSRKTFSSNCGT